MKVTIFLLAVAVAGLIQQAGSTTFAYALMIVAAIELWYEARPIARYKRRVKEREEVREYLRRRNLRGEAFQAIKKKLRLDDPAVMRRIDRWGVIALIALLFLIPMLIW